MNKNGQDKKVNEWLNEVGWCVGILWHGRAVCSATWSLAHGGGVPVYLGFRCLRYLESTITPLTRKSLGRLITGRLGSRSISFKRPTSKQSWGGPVCKTRLNYLPATAVYLRSPGTVGTYFVPRLYLRYRTVHNTQDDDGSHVIMSRMHESLPAGDGRRKQTRCNSVQILLRSRFGLGKLILVLLNPRSKVGQ
jgi:hypothetical protein